MSYTRSHLGALVLGLCWAFACSQKDPNDGLNDTNDTTDTDESDTTEDTSDETTSTASSDDTTTDIESDTTSSPGQTTSESDESDATETTQADASAPDNSDTTDSDTADSDTSDSDTADSDTSDSDTTESDVTSDTSDSDTSDDLDTQICPMAAGASWTYKHTDWTEIQTVTATEYEDEAGFVVKDTPDPEDNLRADTVLIKRDGRLVRVYKEQYWVNPNNDVETLDSKATYGVGFVRCDEAWATKEVGWSETPAYIRVETVGEDPPKAPEERSHTFTVEEREDVSTSNGKTYSNCLKVRRSKDWAAAESAEDAQEKLYWFCPGVGKVREQNVDSGNFEELVEYSLPE